MPIASSRAPRRPADLPANSVRAGSAKGGSNKTTRMGSLFAARLRTTRMRMVGIPSTTSLLKLVVLVSVVTTISVAPLGNQKPKGLVIPDEAKASSATMSAWIDSNRDRKRRRRQHHITGCRVAVVAPSTKHRHGAVYRINIWVTIPSHIASTLPFHGCSRGAIILPLGDGPDGRVSIRPRCNSCFCRSGLGTKEGLQHVRL